MFKFVLGLCAFLLLSEFALVNASQQCGMSDGACKQNMYRNIIRSIAPGVPDKGIPPLDPVPLAGVTITFPNNMDLTLVNGQITDMAKCSYNNLTTNLERRFTYANITCKISINGHYKVKGGQDKVDGYGEGNISIEKLSLDLYMNYHIRKAEDGEIYMHVNHTEFTHTLEISEITFIGDLGLGAMNKKVVDYMNENSEAFQKTFLPLITDKVMDFYYKFTEKFLKQIPAKRIISSDLTLYIEN